ncbi:hypothetical protein [Vibrio harveyi]|uniref:hypothetical protein n=1 Tax=Vibrio harveyi TaxID=669 RepID=UPI003CF156CF
MKIESIRKNAIKALSAQLKQQEIIHEICESKNFHVEDDIIKIDNQFHIAINLVTYEFSIEVEYSLVQKNNNKFLFHKAVRTPLEVVKLYLVKAHKNMIIYNVEVKKFFDVFHIYVTKGKEDFVSFVCCISSRTIAKNIAQNILNELTSNRAYYEDSSVKVLRIGKFKLRTSKNKYLEEKCHLLKKLAF